MAGRSRLSPPRGAGDRPRGLGSGQGGRTAGCAGSEQPASATADPEGRRRCLAARGAGSAGRGASKRGELARCPSGRDERSSRRPAGGGATVRASKRGQLALPRRSPCRAERGATGVGRWLVGCAGSWPVERAPLRVETVQADLRGKYALLRRVYGPRGVSLREFSANQPLSSAFFVSLGQTRCHRRRFNTLRYRWRGLVAEHYSEASDGQSPSGHPKDSILWDPSLSRRISLKRATKATRKIWSSGTRYPGTLDAARHAEGSSDVQMIWLTMLHPSGQSAAQNGFLGPEKRHQWASTCYASSARSLTGPASPSRCQTRRRGGDRKTIIWNGSPHTAPATNKTAQAGGQPPLPPKNQITHHASVPERSGAGTYPKRLHSRGAIRWKRLVDNACRAGPSSERQPLARDRSRRERRCRSGSGGGPTTLYTLLRRHCEAPSAHEAERQDGYRGTLEEWPSARRSAAVRARPSAPRWECANETSRTGAQSLSTQRRWPARSLSPSRRRCSRAATRGTAIWLILPVVICLSQRLSHACLSTYLDMVKLRKAH